MYICLSLCGYYYIRVNLSQPPSKLCTQATAALALEKELRARAEQKEGEEREERVAANAQLLALQTAHASEVEGLRVRGGDTVVCGHDDIFFLDARACIFF